MAEEKATSGFYDNLMGDGETAVVDPAAAAPEVDPSINTVIADAGAKAAAAEAEANKVAADKEVQDKIASDKEAQGAKTEDSPTSDDKVGDDKPLPFDQDSKWKAARAAEMRLEGVLEKYGFSSTEDMEAALESGESLKDVLGNRDAAQLVKDSETLAQARARQEEDRLTKLEGDESEAETISRLKQTNADLHRTNEEREVNRQQLLNTDQALSTFNDRLASNVELEEGLSVSEKSLLSLHLGIDNPINEVDIEDLPTVTKVTQTGIKQFKTLVTAIKQTAIDEYAAGKSKLAPITKATTGSDTQTVTKNKLPKNASVDETFDNMKADAHELFSSIDMEDFVG